MTTPAAPLPRISVVIPSYNHERYLQEAIDSVLAQEGVHLELVIIDDGSGDGSWDIITAAARRDARVRAYAQTNQGAHAAINAGLKASRGEFLAILNSDDRYHPERLATLLQLAQVGDGLDFVSTGLRLIDHESQPVANDLWLDEYKRMRSRARNMGVGAALLERNVTVSTSNFFFRRSLYRALGPIRPLRYNMDWDYALRAHAHSPPRFAWRDDLTLLDYRLHGSNTILRGLPVSAIEANHLLYRALQQDHHVPAAALAGLRRHHRLIRRQQATSVADARDTYWEAELHKAHAGWADARDAHDQVHDRLGQTLTELGAIRDELTQIRASRSYRLGRALTLPLRRLKDRYRRGMPAAAPHAGESVVEAAHNTTPGESPVGAAHDAHTGKAIIEAAHDAHAAPAPVYRRIRLPDAGHVGGEPPRVAVHVHVHHIDLLDELLDAVAQLPAPVDLFVTTTQPVETIESRVPDRSPGAQVWQCANQGKDIGPFIDALNRYRLDRYDLVLKLHSKRSRNQPSYLSAIRGLFGSDLRDGDDWRRKLIAPIAGRRERVARIYQAFADDPQLGMAGAARFICTAPDADTAGYARLCDRLGVSSQVCFFGGTMFWIRGAALGRFIDAGFTLDDFDAGHGGHVESTLEHGCERVFGALVAATGAYVGGLDDLKF